MSALLNDIRRQEARSKAMALRYKKPALMSLGWDDIISELWDIEEACGDVHWFIESENESNLVDALDGDEDEAWEFKMAFSDIEAKCDLLRRAIEECGVDAEDYFDDCMVALIGNTHKLVGFDNFEEDYYSLTSYESRLAETEAGKRIMRYTKPELISKIGQCMGIVLAYMDLRQQYDYLSAAMDVLRGENQSLIKIIKEIDQTYNDLQKDLANNRSWYEFEKMIENLPDRVWIE